MWHIINDYVDVGHMFRGTITNGINDMLRYSLHY